MKKRLKPNLSRIRTGYSYTVEEAAIQMNVHKRTVREWMKKGLHYIDDRKPYLIRGIDLKTFLAERQASRKSKCKPGEIYCCRCRAPRVPKNRAVDVEIITQLLARLTGICGQCDANLSGRTSIKKLSEHAQLFQIGTLDCSSIAVNLSPNLNCYLTKETE